MPPNASIFRQNCLFKSKKVWLCLIHGLIYFGQESESCWALSNSLQPHGLYTPWNSPSQITGVGSCSILQGIFPTLGSNPGFPTLQADSLPAEPPGKPKNTGVGSLSLLQRIFPSQELNWGFLHCRRILYQLRRPIHCNESAETID